MKRWRVRGAGFPAPVRAVCSRTSSAGQPARLRGSPCEPLGPDAGVETINHAVRYPDALVTCSPFDNNERTMPGMVVIFEVLSPPSGRPASPAATLRAGLHSARRA